eukprot:280907-Amphidinium_carterae.1
MSCDMSIGQYLQAFVVTGELDETIPSRALADDDALDREAAEAMPSLSWCICRDSVVIAVMNRI